MYFPYALSIFIILPILEMWILFHVAAAVGFLPTLLLVISTGVIGVSLARYQGLAVINQIQRDMSEGRLPTPGILDGVMILVACAFLITPGLITDTAGFLLLVPPIRILIRNVAARLLAKKSKDGVIDVEFYEE